MIGHRAQRLIARTVVTAAIVAAMAVLILIYVRSGGNGTGAGTARLRANASRAGGSSEQGGQSTAGEAAGSAGSPAASGRPGEATGKGGGASGATGTYTGPAVQTPYGPVQVAVAEEGGRMADVKALQLPTDHAQSLFISERVAPLLREEALQAQSAQIELVSGASFTSEAYAESLQQALSQVP